MNLHAKLRYDIYALAGCDSVSRSTWAEPVVHRTRSHSPLAAVLLRLTDSRSGSGWAQFLAAVCFCLFNVEAQTPSGLHLNVQRDGAKLKASWPAGVLRADGGSAFPVFEVQRSADLKGWSAIGATVQGNGVGQLLSMELPAGARQDFFRVIGRFTPRVSLLAKSGAEVFGYANSFSEELAAFGQITPDQFAALYPAPTSYLPGLDWDPTTADFWPEFNTDWFRRQ